MTRTHSLFAAAAALLPLLTSCGPEEDPVYRRCVTERETYCERLFACVQLGSLVGVSVNFEDEDDCKVQERTRCDEVSEENACPGGSSASYDAAKHEDCIQDQGTQACDAFGERPTSCETYCQTTGG